MKDGELPDEKTVAVDDETLELTLPSGSDEHLYLQHVSVFNYDIGLMFRLNTKHAYETKLCCCLLQVQRLAIAP